MAGSVFAQSSLPACQGVASSLNNCFGVRTFPSGEKYVGEFKDGKFHGQGTFTFANGDKYVGEFKDGKRNGQGIDSYANGDKYVGEFSNGERYGQGTMYGSNGSTIDQGLWADNKFVHSMQVQQANVPDPERASLRAESEEAKRKQAVPPAQNIINKLSIDVAKKKCSELGFRPATEGYGKCVLQLSK